jgi:type VI secretion system Hcp family effector
MPGGISPSGAYEFYVSVDGSAQGAFKGAALDSAFPGRISAIRFSYEIVAAAGAGTGAGAGRRSLEPVTITKEWDASSPQFFHAAITNEMLKSVLFEFARVVSGKSELWYTIKLTNAIVSSYKQYTDLLPEGGSSTFELEDVSFTFQKIDVAHADGTKAGGTAAGGRGTASGGWNVITHESAAAVLGGASRTPARMGATEAGQS